MGTADGGVTTDAGTAAAYLEGCNSLFAARVVEKQVDLDATFPSDCTVALRADVGLLSVGHALCVAGESANACQQRLYATPPPMADLKTACWTVGSSAPQGCLRAKYVPQCANGTETGCTEPEAICQDGTRPLVLAEAATNGPSNTWLFHLGGEGGPCNGVSCWFNYRFSTLEDGPEREEAMSTSHPDHLTDNSMTGRGNCNGNPVPVNPFAGYNRVRFERCTDAASDATETVQIADGIPAEFAALHPTLPLATRFSSAPAFYRGLKTWRALFRSLATTQGRDLDNDGTPDLPSITNATRVVLSASSDASVWLVFAADLLAADLRALAGPGVDVRVTVDGHWEPSLDSAGRLAAGAPMPFNLFANTYGSTGLCALPDNGDGVANETCSTQDYLPGPRPDGTPTYTDGLITRGVVQDESCLAMHGVGAAACRDKTHTLLHHVATPFLILADQEDNTISDGPPIHANDHTYHWATPEAYRAGVLPQSRDVRDFWATAAREEGAGTPGNAVLILPKTRRNGQPWGRATHVRFHDNMEMASGMTRCNAAGVAQATVAYGTMLGAWIDGAPAVTYIAEDAADWDMTSDYWVTGNTCRAPE